MNEHIADKPKRKKTLPKYLNKSEAKDLIDAPYKTNIQDRLIMKLMIFLGLRESEALDIVVLNFDHEDQLVHVIEGKGAIDRNIPLPYEISKDVQEYVRIFHLKPEDKLFDMTPNGLYKLVVKYGRRAEISKKVFPHMLRHTYAVLSLKAGCNLRTVQKNMGHKSLATTQIYLDVTTEDRKEDTMDHPIRLED